MTQTEEVKNSLTKMGEQFSMVLPPQIPLDRFIRVAQTAIQTNPSLLECNRQSLYSSCMKAATDGLLPDGREAALVPFKGVVQYLPMVGGILKKIRNSGLLESIAAHIVYEDDEFRYWVDEKGEHIYHQPNWDNQGIVLLVYAIARTTEGGVYIEVMTTKQVEAVRNVSRAKDAGPWSTWWDEKAKVACIKRLSKRLPMSTDADAVLERDNEENYDLTPEPPAEQVQPKKSRLESLVLPQMVQHGDDVVDVESGEVIQPEPEPPTAEPPKQSKNFEFMKTMRALRTEIGAVNYYGILKIYGVQHCDEIVDRETQLKAWEEMKRFAAALKELQPEEGKE